MFEPGDLQKGDLDSSLDRLSKEPEAAVLRALEPKIRKFARRSEFRLVRAEEAEQSARIGLLKALRNYKYEAGGSLWTFATNYMRGEIWRDFLPNRTEEIPVTTVDHSTELAVSEIRARVIVSSLPPAEGLAVELVVIGQISAAEGGRARGVSRAAISQAVKRGLARLRQDFAQPQLAA